MGFREGQVLAQHDDVFRGLAASPPTDTLDHGVLPWQLPGARTLLDIPPFDPGAAEVAVDRFAVPGACCVLGTVGRLLSADRSPVHKGGPDSLCISGLRGHIKRQN